MTIELTPEHQQIAEEARRRIIEGMAKYACPQVVEHCFAEYSGLPDSQDS